MMPVRVIRRTMRGMFLYGSRGTTVVFGAKLIAGHLFRMGIQGYIAGGGGLFSNLLVIFSFHVREAGQEGDIL